MAHLDTDEYLAQDQHWRRLDKEWGEPVDLEKSVGDVVTPFRQRSKEVKPTFSAEEFLRGVKRTNEQKHGARTLFPTGKRLKPLPLADDEQAEGSALRTEFEQIFGSLQRIAARCIEKRKAKRRLLPATPV